MRVRRRPPPRRWWYETWNGPQGPLMSVVEESRPWQAKEALRAPQPALSASISLDPDGGRRYWLEEIWEGSARRAPASSTGQ